jgi:hypothetical protein
MTKNVAAMMLLALMLSGFSPLAFGEAPSINIPENTLQADPLPADGVTQIKARVKYCLDTIATAKDATEVKRAAAALIDGGYNRYDSSSYRAAYAKTLAQMSVPVLAKIVPADEYRAVPLATSLSQVSEPSALPALEAMVAHPSAGVRYFGWKAFADSNFRGKVLTGKDQMLKLLDLLNKQFKVESSSVVVAEMLDALRPTANADKQVQKKAWEILKNFWPSLGWQVAAGDMEMSRSCRMAVGLVDAMGKDDKKSPQMLLDLLFFSAKAYSDAKGEGLSADTNAQLLRDCETMLASISGIQKKYVQDALGVKDAKERSFKVKLAVLESWVSDLKAKDKSIEEPKMPTPTSAPAPTGVRRDASEPTTK